MVRVTIVATPLFFVVIILILLVTPNIFQFSIAAGSDSQHQIKTLKGLFAGNKSSSSPPQSLSINQQQNQQSPKATKSSPLNSTALLHNSERSL
jgi:hypothetical protein